MDEKNPVFFTIGHSTRTIQELTEMLKSHGIELVADIRTVPGSRHNPQYNRESLSQSLEQAGIRYMYMKDLGGFRRSRPGSVNSGWKNASFRGYADYMQTMEFEKALEELIAAGREYKTALLCAEAVPWRCHRSLVSDALCVKGYPVKHIMSVMKSQDHRITAFAKIQDGKITYPAPAESGTLFDNDKDK